MNTKEIYSDKKYIYSLQFKEKIYHLLQAKMKRCCVFK